MDDLHKAYAYVVRKRNNRKELLVFRHPNPEAGVQVPKGTIDPAEGPGEAVLRELEEESGLTIEDLGRVRMLRADRWRDPARPEDPWTIRHFFTIETNEQRQRWQHVVTGAGLDQGMVFEYYWVPLPLKQKLIAEMDAYVKLLT
jgi:8-oxo-dGTP pyrophosphatase MutT (NUDIX family)